MNTPDTSPEAVAALVAADDEGDDNSRPFAIDRDDPADWWKHDQTRRGQS